MKKLHYAWVICAVSVVLYLCNVGLCSNILAAYLPYIEATGISDSTGSAILSVRCLFSFLSMFAVGVLYRRFSIRTGLLIASLFGIASALVCAVGGSPAVYFAGAALGGVAYGAGGAFPVSLLVSRWFRSRKGLALGISAAGSSLSTMLFSAPVTVLIEKHSLRTAFLTQAAFMSVCCAVCWLLLRDDPAQKGLAPYESSSEALKKNIREVHTELPGSVIWLLGFMMLLNGGVSLSFSGHISVLAKSCGYTAAAAAAVLSFFSLVTALAKFLSGGITDRLGTKRSTAGLIIIFIAGCLCVIPMDGVSLVPCYASALFMGFGASVFNMGPALWAGDLAPKESYPKMVRWLQLFYNLGGIIFTVVPGFIAERSGEYKSSYMLFAFMMALSLFILLWTYRYSERTQS